MVPEARNLGQVEIKGWRIHTSNIHKQNDKDVGMSVCLWQANNMQMCIC